MCTHSSLPAGSDVAMSCDITIMCIVLEVEKGRNYRHPKLNIPSKSELNFFQPHTTHEHICTHGSDEWHDPLENCYFCYAHLYFRTKLRRGQNARGRTGRSERMKWTVISLVSIWLRPCINICISSCAHTHTPSNECDESNVRFASGTLYRADPFTRLGSVIGRNAHTEHIQFRIFVMKRQPFCHLPPKTVEQRRLVCVLLLFQFFKN